MEKFQADSGDEVMISKQNVDKIVHSCENLLSDSKVFGPGTCRSVNDWEQACFSFIFLLDFLSKESILIEIYQGDNYTWESKFWFGKPTGQYFSVIWIKSVLKYNNILVSLIYYSW